MKDKLQERVFKKGVLELRPIRNDFPSDAYENEMRKNRKFVVKLLTTVSVIGMLIMGVYL